MRNIFQIFRNDIEFQRSQFRVRRDNETWSKRFSCRQSLNSIWRQHVGVRAEKLFSIEMNQVVGVFGDPNFCLPRKLREKTSHRFAVRKCSHENQTRFATSE